MENEWEIETDLLVLGYKNYRCTIMRNSVGCLCGYVDIPKNHPWHGKHYDEIECDVHGGLTFSQEHQDGDWVVGFDCGHAGDLIPDLIPSRELINELVEGPRHHNPVYRNTEFVIYEIRKVVNQAIAAEKK